MIMLNQKRIDAAKAALKSYKLADKNGLYLEVLTTGTKVWRYNYIDAAKKQKTKTYGRYPALGIADARNIHADFQDNGKTTATRLPTFTTVFEDWLAAKLPCLKNPKHKIQVEETVRRFVIPTIGQLSVDKIKRLQLVGVVRSVEALGVRETAHRVAGRICAVFDYAVDSGYLESHPAVGLSRVLARKKNTKHMPSIDPIDAPKLFAAIKTYGEPVTRLGLEFLAHTFVRVGEARFMRWSELIDDDTWVVPETRMKMGLPHVVPLSKQVKELLDELRQYTADSEFVFSSPIRRAAPISENTHLFALYSLGYRGKMTAHGFRALASSVLNVQSGYKADIIERQLAHQEKDAVRDAYHRAEYLDERRKMMQWWSDWISAASGKN